MRTRNLKPGFFTNEVLGTTDPLVQLLFAGLWLIADRDGRLEDRPARIKAFLFPYRPIDIDTILTDLAGLRDSDGNPFIVRYQDSQHRRLIAIMKFDEHQNPHPKEPSLNLEPPTLKQEPRTFTAEPCKEVSGNVRLPYSPSPNHLDIPSPTPREPRRVRVKSDPGEGFDEFWKAYPRKEAKAKAVEAWNKIQPDMPVREAILSAIARQRTSADWVREAGRYIPHPATYLNQRRWEDDLTRLEVTTHASQRGQGFTGGNLGSAVRIGASERSIEAARAKTIRIDGTADVADAEGRPPAQAGADHRGHNAVAAQDDSAPGGR